MKSLRLLCLGLLMLAGCQTYYYKITDNKTGKDYFEGPMMIVPSQLPDTMTLKDPKTGATTMTDQYTVTPITKEEFTAKREAAKSESKPTP